MTFLKPHANDSPEAFPVDGLQPGALERPTGENELRTLVERARRERLALIPSGGGTARHIGNVPARFDVAVDLSGLAEIGDYSPDDMVVTAQAGVPLVALEALLAQHGQRLPLEAPQGATVGGVVASGQAGRRRLSCGTPRDWLIGARAVLGDGRSVRAGAKVLKSVAGYDLLKLWCGSGGTLAILTEVTFKVAPLPEAIAEWCVPCSSLAQADSVRRAAMAWRPAWVELEPASDAPFSVAVGFEGDAAAVSWQSERFTSRFAEVRPHTAKAHPTGPGASPCVLVLATLPDQLTTVLERCLALGPVAVRAHLASGLARLEAPNADAETLAAWMREVEAAGGWWRLDEGPKAGRECFGPWRPDWLLSEKIKQLLDPDAILSPGRSPGRI